VLPEAQRVRAILLTRYCRRHAGGTDRARRRPSRPIARWLRSDPPLPGRIAHCWADALALNLVPGPQTAQPDDLAMLPYTSARPVRPKAALHTHRTLDGQLLAAAGSGATRAPRPVSLAVVPMFHITRIVVRRARQHRHRRAPA